MNLRDIPSILVILFLLPYVVVMLSNSFAENGQEFINDENDKCEEEPSGYGWKIIVEKEGLFEQMGLETYVCGAAAGVLPADSEPEFMKAQMILVRTNIVRELLERTEHQATQEVSAKELSEQYADIHLWEQQSGIQKNKLYEAAQATKGKILTYEGQPVEAAYHAVSNGTTREGKEVLGENYPYLTARTCSEDMYAKDYFFRKEYKEKEWNAENVEILNRDRAGYVLWVRESEEIVTGEFFRKKHNLNSADFTIAKSDEGWIVTTKGYGHGLGMSQYTANQMALKGMDHETILSEFFPGTECKKFE